LSSQALTIEPKRLRADAVRNRAKVLEAARAAFAEHGAEAQMEDVARRAGVGVGTVYRHFPTKHALAAALVEEKFDRVIAHARELLDEPDPWRAIERSFEFCATAQEQDRAYAGVLAGMAAGGPAAATPPVAGPREHQLGELLAITERMLARARVAGAIRDDLAAADMPPLYCGLASVVQAGVTDWRRYLELLLDGLRPRADVVPSPPLPPKAGEPAPSEVLARMRAGER
jgi:AcrR family transcriptional regulator